VPFLHPGKAKAKGPFLHLEKAKVGSHLQARAKDTSPRRSLFVQASASFSALKTLCRGRLQEDAPSITFLSMTAKEKQSLVSTTNIWSILRVRTAWEPGHLASVGTSRLSCLFSSRATEPTLPSSEVQVTTGVPRAIWSTGFKLKSK
jgi:hypothetical protein